MLIIVNLLFQKEEADRLVGEITEKLKEESGGLKPKTRPF